MKIDHLTFRQLYRLSQPETLMRVTRAYHGALRRAANWSDNLVLIAELEQRYPEVKTRYWPVIHFLRSDNLQSALRKSARKENIPPSCTVSLYRSLPERLFPNARVRHALASLIATHSRCHGVPAEVDESSDGTFRVWAATDEMGCALLTYKPGLKWSTIELMCYSMNVNIDRVFWWLQEYRDKTGWRVNPGVWPVNTPDITEQSAKLANESMHSAN